MDILDLVVNLFTNTDAFLVSLATDYGTLIYAAMFLIFFLETGFVIMSFLPGDSLLFVAGTVAASGTASPWLIMLAVIVGAIAGNTLGYEQGRWLGNRIYSGNISWINEKKLRHAHDFYMRHGGKTILLAGHNNTFFNDLQHAEAGATVTITTHYGVYTYEVTGTEILDYQDETAYDFTRTDENLILYTCYPFDALGFTPNRFFVYAKYVSGPVLDANS